jgi:glycosyltransferase involved in cell wall biosynthesis
MASVVSILINNWNYGEYVGQAIESALGQTYRHVEVVVVDDGSTDNSRAVLARYADRVTVIMQEGGGQPGAAATGLAASRGEIVMFLDADDFLAPDAAARVVAAWADDCAKVQFRLSLVDGAGRRRGADPPLHVAMPAGDLVPEIATRGGYETPVTSGNAYPRGLLERLFPVPREFRYFDPYLNMVAPFYGPVVSIDEELGAYRLHGRNGWALTDRVDAERIRERLTEDLLKERYIEQTAAATGRDFPRGTALRKPTHVLYRLASLRLEPAAHPVPEDSRRHLLRAGLRALRADRHLPFPDKLFLAAVLVLTAVGPKRIARSAVEFALLSRPRPAWLQATARAVRRGAAVVRGASG